MQCAPDPDEFVQSIFGLRALSKCDDTCITTLDMLESAIRGWCVSYGEVRARRNVYSATPRYHTCKCTATHGTPRGTHGGPRGVVQQIPMARFSELEGLQKRFSTYGFQTEVVIYHKILFHIHTRARTHKHTHTHILDIDR